jgi:hypothetical protein
MGKLRYLWRGFESASMLDFPLVAGYFQRVGFFSNLELYDAGH